MTRGEFCVPVRRACAKARPRTCAGIEGEGGGPPSNASVASGITVVPLDVLGLVAVGRAEVTTSAGCKVDVSIVNAGLVSSPVSSSMAKGSLAAGLSGGRDSLI